MRICRIIILLLFSISPNAETTTYFADTHTTYDDDSKRYTTTSQKQIKTSMKSVDKVIDRFITDLTNDPKILFDKSLAGLGVQGNGSDIFVIEYKDYTYDAANQLYTGTLNVVAGKTSLANVDFTGKISRNSVPDKTSDAVFKLLNTNPVVKLAEGKILAEKIDDQHVEITQIAMFEFSWFFNIFFKQNKYKNIVEWRLDKFMQNIVEEILKEEA